MCICVCIVVGPTRLPWHGSGGPKGLPGSTQHYPPHSQSPRTVKNQTKRNSNSSICNTLSRSIPGSLQSWQSIGPAPKSFGPALESIGLASESSGRGALKDSGPISDAHVCLCPLQYIILADPT